MSIWVLLSQGLLAALVALLFYTMMRQRARDTALQRDTGSAPVFSSSEEVERRPSADVSAESKAQIHLFWAAQLLELRLKKFDTSQLSAPALQSETRKYLEGVGDCVADHYRFPALTRARMIESLQDKYVFRPAPNTQIPQFDLKTVTGSEKRNESYQSGYEAAAFWLENRKFKSDLSLMAAIERWGFIS